MIARARNAPERWTAETTSRDVVKLEIPADAARTRRFEISIRLAVANPGARRDASHALRALIDGALEWQRRVATDPGPADTLEWRAERVLEPGRPLRLNATCEVRGAQRVRLAIEAEEA